MSTLADVNSQLKTQNNILEGVGKDVSSLQTSLSSFIKGIAQKQFKELENEREENNKLTSSSKTLTSNSKGSSGGGLFGTNLLSGLSVGALPALALGLGKTLFKRGLFAAGLGIFADELAGYITSATGSKEFGDQIGRGLKVGGLGLLLGKKFGVIGFVLGALFNKDVAAEVDDLSTSLDELKPTFEFLGQNIEEVGKKLEGLGIPIDDLGKELSELIPDDFTFNPLLAFVRGLKGIINEWNLWFGENIEGKSPQDLGPPKDTTGTQDMMNLLYGAGATAGGIYLGKKLLNRGGGGGATPDGGSPTTKGGSKFLARTLAFITGGASLTGDVMKYVFGTSPITEGLSKADASKVGVIDADIKNLQKTMADAEERIGKALEKEARRLGRGLSPAEIENVKNKFSYNPDRYMKELAEKQSQRASIFKNSAKFAKIFKVLKLFGKGGLLLGLTPNSVGGDELDQNLMKSLGINAKYIDELGPEDYEKYQKYLNMIESSSQSGPIQDNALGSTFSALGNILTENASLIAENATIVSPTAPNVYDQSVTSVNNNQGIVVPQGPTYNMWDNALADFNQRGTLA